MVCLPRDSASKLSRGGNVLSAVNVIRSLRTGPNRLLVTATDGRLYVLKLCDKQRKQDLLNESFGTTLAANLGLPVPNWRPIFVSRQFINSLPQECVESTLQSVSTIFEGWYFGSEMVAQVSGQTVCDYLPGKWMDKIENRSEFAGALLLDIWANNAQCRQAIFFQEENSDSFKAVFIGFRGMFSNAADASSIGKGARYSDKRIYDGHWNETLFSFWQERILSIRESRLRGLLLQLPKEWIDRELAERIIGNLLIDQKMIERTSFNSLNPCILPWKHPREGMLTDREPPAARRFTEFAFGI